MSVISSNTLFHFTNSAENLIKILKNGFRPRFCLEEFGPEVLISGDSRDELALPMSCFCDLPLSKLNQHLDFYGSYGIGLTKNWGKNKGLTPLTYIHTNSIQVTHLRRIVNHLNKDASNFKLLPYSENPFVALIELSAFFKPYEGKMWRNGEYVDKRYYDEKEWRYVPFIYEKEATYRLYKEEFLNETIKANANETIDSKYNLSFCVSDIKYLIVKKELEMISLSDALDTMKAIFSEKEIKTLRTKIISSEQINEDF